MNDYLRRRIDARSKPHDCLAASRLPASVLISQYRWRDSFPGLQLVHPYLYI